LIPVSQADPIATPGMLSSSGDIPLVVSLRQDRREVSPDHRPDHPRDKDLRIVSLLYAWRLKRSPSPHCLPHCEVLRRTIPLAPAGRSAAHFLAQNRTVSATGGSVLQRQPCRRPDRACAGRVQASALVGSNDMRDAWLGQIEEVLQKPCHSLLCHCSIVG
jgi:hypothetical protein